MHGYVISVTFNVFNKVLNTAYEMKIFAICLLKSKNSEKKKKKKSLKYNLKYVNSINFLSELTKFELSVCLK